MAMPGEAGSDDEPSGGSSTLRLGLLFGTIYFVQGIGEPTEGLIIQPVRTLLSTWGHGPEQIAAFVALLAVPWSLKPLFGLLTDFVPLAGTRRRAYLIATSATTVLGFVVLAALPIPRGNQSWLFAWLFVPTIAVAFSDVVADALMIEKGQPLGLTGRLQSIQWACMYAATILTGLVGGYLSQNGQHRLGFLICGGLALVTLALSIWGVRERPRSSSGMGLRAGLSALGDAVRSPGIAGVGAFLFLWNFNPFSNTVLHLHMTQAMGFSDQFYGHTVSLLAIGCVAASFGYGFYCRRIPMPWLVHASIVLGITSTLTYWAMADHVSAVLVNLVVGFTYMTATLIQLDLAAQSCPARVAGTGFAILMALSNLGTVLSTWLGGAWYERGRALWGSQVSFQVLVGVGAAFTAACWLIVPFLPRAVAGLLPATGLVPVAESRVALETIPAAPAGD
jgi:MFS family permease